MISKSIHVNPAAVQLLRQNAEQVRLLAGLPVQSIQWGAWSGMGMVATSAAVLARMERSGISPVAPKMGLRALQNVFCASSSTVSPKPMPHDYVTESIGLRMHDRIILTSESAESAHVWQHTEMCPKHIH